MATKSLDTTPGGQVGWMSGDPGLKQDVPDAVRLDQYLRAAGAYGGNRNVLKPKAAISHGAKGKSCRIVEAINSSDFGRAFNWQCKPEHQLSSLTKPWAKEPLPPLSARRTGGRDRRWPNTEPGRIRG